LLGAAGVGRACVCVCALCDHGRQDRGPLVSIRGSVPDGVPKPNWESSRSTAAAVNAAERSVTEEDECTTSVVDSSTLKALPCAQSYTFTGAGVGLFCSLRDRGRGRLGACLVGDRGLRLRRYVSTCLARPDHDFVCLSLLSTCHRASASSCRALSNAASLSIGSRPLHQKQVEQPLFVAHNQQHVHLTPALCCMSRRQRLQV
jgi:hypothetical protein